MSSAAKHRTVLVVEDEDDIRAAIAEILEGEGYDVTVACNGREAMDELTDVRYVPSLILLDLMMPEMNGHEFLERRRSIARLRNVPVMVLTAVTTDIPLAPTVCCESPSPWRSCWTRCAACCPSPREPGRAHGSRSNESSVSVRERSSHA